MFLRQVCAHCLHRLGPFHPHGHQEPLLAAHDYAGRNAHPGTACLLLLSAIWRLEVRGVGPGVKCETGTCESHRSILTYVGKVPVARVVFRGLGCPDLLRAWELRYSTHGEEQEGPGCL